MYYNDEDIITALATPPGKGAIAIVRLSGPDCLNTFRKCVKGYPVAPKPRDAVLTVLADERGEFDQAVAIYYRNPLSYTGEDLLEINCHGGEYITQRLLDVLCRNGARPAEPGEFTYRAFINGKINLTQAEAVADVIAAESELGNRNSVRQLQGGLSDAIIRMRKELISVLAELEVELEFPDDEPMEADYWGWSERMKDALNELEEIIRNSSKGRVIREGFRVVIAGPPNSGKSTLLNTLLGENRAIVHRQAGTTRDVLRESVEIGGLKVILSDTAGLRNIGEEVESEGIRRAYNEMISADMILYILDLCSFELLDDPDTDKTLVIGNKVDICSNTDIKTDLNISALKKTGIDELKRLIRSRALKSGVENGIIANERHLTAMRRSSANIQKALEIANLEGETELIAFEVREALRNLGSIIGEDVTEEVLENIFSRFCIGK